MNIIENENRYSEVLCPTCMSLQAFEINTEREKRIIDGKDYYFNKRIGVCTKCGNQVMVPGLDDENERNFEEVFRASNGYIQVYEIESILDKYNIEKRPLSKALGMGEHTVEKYLEGQLPSRKNSDRLKSVLLSYATMYSYFVDNKEKLTPKAQEKLESKLEYYKSINDYKSKIELVALYVLNSKYEITNLSLQKLLYYIEGFSHALLHEKIFNSRCEAWMYGPVYKEIYDKYKVFGSDQIIVDAMDFEELIEEKQRKLIDYVLKNFAIYNGVTLKDLSHAEQPWIKAHEGYSDKERCEEEITHESIAEYFFEVNKNYHLDKDTGVKAYIESLNVL